MSPRLSPSPDRPADPPALPAGPGGHEAPCAAPVPLAPDLSAISHGLRTPLDVIAGSVWMLSGAPTPTEREAHLASLRDAVDEAVGAVALVEDLLRLVAGGTPPGQADAPLAETLAGAIAAAAERIEARGLAAECRIADSAPASLPRAAARIIELSLRAAVDGALRPETLLVVADGAAQGGRPGIRVTVFAGSVAAWADVPPGVEFPPGSAGCVRSQDTLPFAVARRLAEALGGRLLSWSGSGGAVAYRAWLPR